MARALDRRRWAAAPGGPGLTRDPRAGGPAGSDRRTGGPAGSDRRTGGPAGSDRRTGDPRRADRRTVDQGGRAKAYRPLPAEARAAAFAAGLAAYEAGDFFEAHELLEPAWMGTADLGERALYQGLIKLAAAYVHAVRGNPVGLARNLAGARPRLADAAAAGWDGGLDLDDLLAAVDERLAMLAARTAAVGQREDATASERRGSLRLEPPTLRRHARATARGRAERL